MASFVRHLVQKNIEDSSEKCGGVCHATTTVDASLELIIFIHNT